MIYLISSLALRENMEEFDKSLENISNIDSATEKSLRDAIENALVNLKAGRKQKKVFTVAVRGDDLKKQLEEDLFK